MVLLLAFLPALLSPALPSSTAVRSASNINARLSDLGSDWSFWTEGSLTGPLGLVDYSSLGFQRSSAYGGTVSVGSSVEIYNTTANASRRFEEIRANLSEYAGEVTVDVGDEGLLYATGSDVSLLFLHGDTVVYMGAGGYGPWEDLTGRAFSTEYRLAGDLVVLGHIVDSRI